MLIVIEGLDASGKATQARLLAERLDAQLFSFHRYDTPVGGAIKAHLHNEWQARVDPRGGIIDAVSQYDALAFQGLALMDKCLAAVEIRRLISRDQVVVCDRYWQSAYAYGGADGLDKEMLVAMHAVLPQGDLNLLLDVPLDMTIERQVARGLPRDRYEQDVQKLHQVRENYHELWDSPRSHPENSASAPRRWEKVDGSLSVLAVSKYINALVAQMQEELR